MTKSGRILGLGLTMVALASCAGADGTSCTVAENDDGTATITCEDGTSAVLRNGVDGMEGMDGMDGVSCTVTTGADNSATLTCEDGTSATITNGMDGSSCSVADNGDGTSTITCTDGTSATVSSGTDGADGTSCSVTDNGDGTSTISCTDGTSSTVSNGTDGTSCSVTDNGDGTSTISCADGTSATVSNGADGTDGTDGTSCTVADNGDGTSTVSCTDGTSVTLVSGSACTVSDAGNGLFTVDCDGTSFTTARVARQSVAFPDTGDTRVVASGSNFWNAGDYVQGTRSTTLTAPLAGLLTLNLTSNGLTCDTQDANILINGSNAGSLSIAPGATSVTARFDARMITDPTYTIRIQTSSTVSSGCGSAGYVNGTSSVELIGIP